LRATISEGSATPAFIGQISGLAIDAQGRVYVSDFQEPRVLVFSADGKQLAVIGRKGQGPGEFTAPTGPVIGADGALYVRNLHHVLRFQPAIAGGVASKFDRSFDGPPMAPWLSMLPSAIDQQGRFYFPMEVGLRDGLTHYWYERYTLAGKRVDSLPVPVHPTTRSSWASVMVAPGTGRKVNGVNVVPFHPLPQWTILPGGTLLSGAADATPLVESDATGRAVRRVPVPGAAVKIPEAERRDSLGALKARLDSIKVPLTEVRGMSDEVQKQQLPTSYPTYRGLLSVGDAIWLLRWTVPAQRKGTVIDVVGGSGQLVRTIWLPVACESVPMLAVGGRTVACRVVDPVDGSEGVAVFELPASR
jgi:hypothetical protein